MLDSGVFDERKLATGGVGILLELAVEEGGRGVITLDVGALGRALEEYAYGRVDRVGVG